MEWWEAELEGAPSHPLCNKRHFIPGECPDGYTNRQHAEFIKRVNEKNLTKGQQDLVRMVMRQANRKEQ